MSELCRLLGKAAGFSKDKDNNLAMASAMHDVGKIGIPDSILLKPGKLAKAEFDIMHAHSTRGAKIPAGSSSKLLQVAETICLTHHEKWDGSGYPNNLTGKEIPPVGRIACICDVFDALIAKRPYKGPWPIDKALAEIEALRGTFLIRIWLNIFCAWSPISETSSRFWD